MNAIASQLKQAFRALVRSPGFTLPIVLILGLGLGVNLALHAILQAVQHRALPVARREQLLLVQVHPRGEKELWNLSHPQFEDLKAFPGPFSAMAEALLDSGSELEAGNRTLHVTAPLVGEGWFQTLGLQPSLGRTFTQEEQAAGVPVAVLSHRLWRTAFQGDPAIVGKSIRLGRDTGAFTVVGVGPAGFEGLEAGRREDLWLPLNVMKRIWKEMPPDFFTSRNMSAFSVVMRMREGTSRLQAQAALEAAWAATARSHPEDSVSASGTPVTQDLEASEQKLLQRVLPQRTLLRLAAGLALLLAVVATSGLFAARAARRGVELATRQALGAGLSDLVRPMIMEALLLALMALPVALGSGLLLARRFMLQPGQISSEAVLLPGLDGRLLGFGLALSLGALLLAALVPLLKVRRLDPARALVGQGGRSGLRAGGGPFVAAQVALSLLLLTASSLALNAFRSAARMGYPTAHRALMVVDCANDAGLPDRLLARLHETPGLRSIAKSAAAPLGNMRILFGLSGGDQTKTEHYPAAMVGAGWFRALGVPIVEGREFGERDGQSAVILNESLAKRFFPGRSAVGQRLDMGGGQPLEILGVAADHRMRPDPEFHLPMLWLTTDWIKTNQFCVLAEGRGGARALLDPLRAALQAEKPGAEPIQLLTLEDHVASTLHRENQNLRLLGSLGLGSLLLACFGLWAALNLQVALRGREMAIRMALGATAHQILSRILALGLRLLILGLATGALLAWMAVHFAGARWGALPTPSLLHLLVAAGALTAAGLLACLIPALRAARVDPAQALRSE